MLRDEAIQTILVLCTLLSITEISTSVIKIFFERYKIYIDVESDMLKASHLYNQIYKSNIDIHQFMTTFKEAIITNTRIDTEFYEVCIRLTNRLTNNRLFKIADALGDLPNRLATLISKYGCAIL